MNEQAVLGAVLIIWFAVGLGRFLRKADEGPKPETTALVPYGKYDLKKGGS